MRRAATRLLLGRLGGPSAALPGAVEEAGAAVRVTTSSAVAAERSGLHGPAAAAAAAASDGGAAGPSTPDRVAKVIAHSFHRCGAGMRRRSADRPAAAVAAAACLGWPQCTDARADAAGICRR